ncbi:PIN domain-containing protein [Cyanobium sp. ATX 6F1]|uniref:PIN domain-containing protein n=1 Tax=unclassified Cyanobium TaxID=2627006 RepID=UPI0020CDB8DD|nr:PIN domain-containing protein [Cyanobium sp. ATX 6F1]MCP9915251.1 hypothetical protein [Cyanobium sp. ATX 6F1]
MSKERKRLVLDANILIRGVFGVRVSALIAEYADRVDFFVAQANTEEAAHYIAELSEKRKLNPEITNEAFLRLMRIVQVVDDSALESAQQEAEARIRDPSDWPALALAIQLECPIWSEDQDFFGTGVATWVTATVEVFLRD